MGLGMGFIAQGINEGVEDVRRRNREDQKMELELQRGTREQTTFENTQEDRPTEKAMKGLGLKAAQRADELAVMEAEIKKNDLESLKKIQGARDQATQMKAVQEVAELEEKNRSIIYNAYKTRGGAAAARLLNQMSGSSIQDAADFIEETDPKTKRKVIKVVDALGKVVMQDGKPVVFDSEALEKRYGVKVEKGTYSESERGVLDTRSGKFKAHPPEVAGLGKKPNIELKNYMRNLTNDGSAIILKKFGGTLDPMGNITSFAEGQEQKALDALEIGSDLVSEGHSPQRAANMAIELVDKGAKPKSKRNAAPVELIRPGLGMGMQAPGTGVTAYYQRGVPRRSAPPGDPNAYYQALRSAPQNKGVSDDDLLAYVLQKFPNWNSR